MRRIFPAVFFMILVFLVSCSTDVDLYAEGEETPIVYGLLDAQADTTFIKITHALKPENSLLNAASDQFQNEYPEKLDVRLTEFCNGDSLRQIILDTITIHNKQEGLFYAPAQKLYYTPEPIHQNTSNKHYRYRLTIVFPDHTWVTEEDMVGTDEFRVVSGTADFSGGYLDKAASYLLFLPADKAGIYDISMTFTFYECRTFTSDTVKRTIKWPVGSYYTTQLNHQMDAGAYKVYYGHDDLYDKLEEVLGDDTVVVPGLRRYITDYPITVTIQAGGEHLALYRYYHSVSDDTFNGEGDITLMDGVLGVFSTKKTITKRLRLGGTTVPELMYQTKWGFRVMGGH